ncbi:MAG: hypothetical protein A3G59_02975 [Candidatus Taylorbacteria bacterium RIFCSPLOWO2_12_FULL_47_20]|uniref:Uncharacterized protein n=1 Tax=Candidatus Taylorbacteria bacterium RIFCSPLOWO2_12_FULL_47_20 TaxID=1802335 RepID=A0A1G2P7P4_9BACT|nr:MAG: hypothetical protein A3G59_02975 [Candidatus Taylorbacteria bacterium RIFCSPLOWO2_12_FULL_47_20]
MRRKRRPTPAQINAAMELMVAKSYATIKARQAPKPPTRREQERQHIMAAWRAQEVCNRQKCGFSRQ